jgi:GNAT superfamily N-acetyltransferase
MAAQLTVRSVRAEDYERWLPLWRGYNAFYGRSGPTALAPEITAVTWRRLLDPDEPVHAVVAEARGHLIGLAHYLFHPSTIAVGPSCYLQDLFTAPAARGAGVGRRLIEEVYRRARRSGAGRVYWQTQETNVIARRLYDQLAEHSGFIVYRRVF